MEKITCTDRVRNEKVLHRVQREKEYIRKTKRRKANLIGQILRRNCPLKTVLNES